MRIYSFFSLLSSSSSSSSSSLSFSFFSSLTFFLSLLSLTSSLRPSHKSFTLSSCPLTHFNGTIHIGATISFQSTDQYFSYGSVMANSWNMFLEWVNFERGGITIGENKYSISLTYIEDYSNPNYVSELCQLLIDKPERILYMFGPYSSGLNEACSRETESKQMLMMSGGSSDTVIFRNANYLFGTLPGALRYISSAFTFLEHSGASSVAVIRDSNYPSCDDTTIAQAKILSNLTVYGIFDVNVNSPTYHNDLLLILAQLKFNGIETIYGCSYSTLCLQLPSISKTINYNPEAIVFTSCLSSTSVLNDLGDDAHYLYAVTPWTPTDDLIDKYTGWTAAEFNQKYIDIYNRAPTYHAASTFAAAESLIVSIEKCQCLNNSQALVDILETNHFQTFYANFSYNTDHQAVFKMLITQMIQINGTWDQYVITPETALYPVPTWAQRDCLENTDSCSAHGQCNSTGYCTCDPGYYGSMNPLSCDTYCDGDVVNGKCRPNTVLYIGGMVAYQYAEGDEYQANMRLAVNLINNKTDGWFDDSTSQIFFVMQLNNSGCDTEQAVTCLDYQNEWSVKIQGTPLDGLIGAECSAGSISTASIGSSLALPQISFKSSTTELSDKDLYPYFARTCASDAAQGPALTTLLIQIGVTPYVVVVSTTDGYGTSMSTSFTSSYEAAGNIILDSITYTVSESIDYDEIITRIAQTGTPAIVLILYPEEVEKVLNAASRHPVLSSDDVIWIGPDSWIDLELILENGTTLPNGIIGVSAYQANNSETRRYTELWKSLDPIEYPDTDGDRETFSSYSLYIMDAVTALALAYQKTIQDSTGLEGANLRQYVYNTLIKDVAFLGVSGNINFDAQGDLTNPQFRIVNYVSGVGWNTIGTATSTSVTFTEEMVWPDGTVSAYSTAYSDQLVPYCSPGEEPVLGSNGVYICSQCNVGYYSSTWASDKCKECPIGTDCNNVGIIIPCLLKDYWRSIPPTVDDEADFQTYGVYPCDRPENCLGGCSFNSSCAENYDDLAPTCAVCVDGFYLHEGECLKCTVFRGALPVLISGYLCILTIFVAGLCIIMWDNVRSALRMPITVEQQRSTEQRPTEQQTSRLTSMFGLRRFSLYLQNTNVHPSTRKKVFRGTAMTFKLLLSFIQVVGGSYYMINLNWSSHTEKLFGFLNINPLQAIDASYQCSTYQYSSNLRYLLVLILHFLLPLFFFFLLFCVCVCVYFYGRSVHEQSDDRVSSRLTTLRESCSEDSVNQHEKTSVEDKQLRLEIWNVAAKIFLWFCLISYPSLSAGMLEVYNCRDLGITGIFLRSDYSVDCKSITHRHSVLVASIGTLLYPVGIPVLFYVVIRYRNHYLLRVPSELLYQNFAPEWIYYEVYDLIRKLMLTSVMPFISPPDTSSQCLYLFCVDMLALIVLAYSRPYANEYDDLLSGVLIAVECMLFLLALVIVSGISEEDNYNHSVLYNTAFTVVVIALGCVLPWTLAMKFHYMRNKIQLLMKTVKERALSVGIDIPDFRRLDVKWRVSEDMTLKDLGPPTETVVTNFNSECTPQIDITHSLSLSDPSPSSRLSQTPKSRLLAFKGAEDVLNPLGNKISRRSVGNKQKLSDDPTPLSPSSSESQEVIGGDRPSDIQHSEHSRPSENNSMVVRQSLDIDF